MAALYIIGGIALLLVLLCQIRVGALLCFGTALTVDARVGPVRLRLIPKKERKHPKKEKPPKPPKEKKKSGAGGGKPAVRTKPKIGFEQIRSGAETLLPALGRTLRRTRRSIRIRPFVLYVVFGGDDPADTAKFYGWAEALMWTVMPEAERLLVLPSPHVKLDCDFTGGPMRAEGKLGLSIRIGSILRIALTMAIPALKWYRRLPRVPAEPAAEKQADKPGAAPAAPAAGTRETNEQSER